MGWSRVTITCDGYSRNGLAAAGGGLGVVHPLSHTGGASNLIVDSVGYGTALTSTAKAPPPGAGQRQLHPRQFHRDR